MNNNNESHVNKKENTLLCHVLQLMAELTAIIESKDYSYQDKLYLVKLLITFVEFDIKQRERINYQITQSENDEQQPIKRFKL